MSTEIAQMDIILGENGVFRKIPRKQIFFQKMFRPNSPNMFLVAFPVRVV